MISYISIKNFAIIENTEVEFEKGLNIITGETGAGKSIVIEAISLALGARADASYVRTGTDKAIVQLAGDIDGDEIIITREVSATGKNLCKLNGEIVTLTQLTSYCHKLADIHGQYDHQSLLNPDYHIHLIDKYHSNDIDPIRQLVSDLYTEYVEVGDSLRALISNAAETEKKRDFMRFQLDEIRSANLVLGEDESLKEAILLMQNSEKIYKALALSYENLYDATPSVLNLLEEVSRNISSLSEYSEDLSTLGERISDIYYNLEDVARDVRISRERAIFSQEDLDNSIARFETIEGLKRKYGNSISDILKFANDLEDSLSEVENIDSLKEELNQKYSVLKEKLTLASSRLTELRKRAAAELEKKIVLQLNDLAFNNSDLKIEFSALPSFTENGVDSVHFLISTNTGEPLKPLSKIASGGEMSRIMLAFKKIIADYDDIPTLIFDEIDTGISGIAASIVGKKLKEISSNHQIICITHLPQIAACGDYNYRIEKSVQANATTTVVKRLDSAEQISEIARLLGGTNITDITLKSAKELIEASKKSTL